MDYQTYARFQQPVAPPRWMHDDESLTCYGCNSEFDSVVNRRHHCRRCGLLYCDSCSDYRCLIHPANVVYPPDWDSVTSSFDPRQALRVCRGCFEHLAPEQDELLRTTANAAQPTEVDREDYARYANVPIQFEMKSEILKATNTLHNFCADNAIEGVDSVPSELIASAWGLAFVTTMQAGFFFSGRMGSGLVIARTPDGGWSAPSAVCTAGAGWGLQIGGEVTDMLIVLNSQEAVEAFSSTAQLSLGTELSLALGPMGRSGETTMTAGDNGVSAVFSYAHSKGFFVGIALHACVILARPDCNERFYGKRYDTTTILSGGVERPVAAEPLYHALFEVIKSASSDNIPDHKQKQLSMEELPRVEVRVKDLEPATVFRGDASDRGYYDDNGVFTYHQQPIVRAAPPISEYEHALRQEQIQIDADLALALAMADEDNATTSTSSAPPSSRPAPRAPTSQLGSSRYAAAPPPQDNSSWTDVIFGPSEKPKPTVENDDWEKEREKRLAAAIQDRSATVTGFEELKPMYSRPARAPVPTRTDGPDYDEDNSPSPRPTTRYTGARLEEEVTL